MNGISVLIKETSEDSLAASTTQGHRKKLSMKSQL